MINVIIIEDDREYRDILNDFFNSTRDICCTGCYNTCEEALEDLENSLPDVVMLDIHLPDGMNGIEGARYIKERLPETHIIMLTVFADNEHVFKALQNGAVGYLVKKIKPLALISAVKEVYQGGSPMSMKIARMVTEYFHSNPPPEPLTKREREVLSKLCEGKTYQTIAEELFVEKSTIKYHIHNIYRILHVSSKGEAIAKAKDQRIV